MAKKFRLLFKLISIVALIVISVITPSPTLAQRPNLPAPLCVLIGFQIICYDTSTVTPRVLTPSEQRVIDFAIAPDGEWLAYRAGDVVQIVSVYGTSASQIDPQAPAPIDLDLTSESITWSPTGQAIAYATASGVKIALSGALSSGANQIQILNVSDRIFTNLRFSPDGSKLAAQGDDGGWSIFVIQTNDDGTRSVLRTRSISQVADLAWMDNNSIVIAPVSGGASLLDANSPDSAPRWTIQSGLFVKLITSTEGDVLALAPEPGTNYGPTVVITATGVIKALGTAKIDTRVEWGAGGKLMAYLTSGTPILVDRINSDEDTLPLRRVRRLLWAPAPPAQTSNVNMDGDLYFIAPGTNGGIRQVWRLPGSGIDSVKSVTDLSQNAEDFAVSPDKTRLVVAAGQRLVLVTSAGNATPTPAPRTTPEGPNGRPLVAINSLRGLDWEPNGSRVVYADASGVNLLTLDGKTTPLVTIADTSKEYYALPRFSPDGRYIAVKHYTLPATFRVTVFNLRDGSSTEAPDMPDGNLSWGPGNLLVVEKNCQTDTRLMAFSVPEFKLARVMDASMVVADARFSSNEQALILRRHEWTPTNGCADSGPSIVQLFTTSIKFDGKVSKPESRSNAYLLSSPLLSPTGKYAAGFWQADKINQLMVLNLQNGRRVTIAQAFNVSALRWVN